MYALVPLVVPIQSAGEGGLSLHQIASNFPSDPASIAVILLVTVSLVLVAWTGRPRGKGGRPR